jgi:hypothetical protein
VKILGILPCPFSLQFSCSAFWVILIYWFYWLACKEGKPVLRKNQAIWTCVCIVLLIDCAVDSYRSTKDTLNIFEQTMCVRIVMNRTSMIPACLVCLLITLTLTGQVFSWTHILYILYHFMIFVTIYTYIYIYTVLIRAGGSFFGTPQLVQSLCPSLSLTKLKTATEFNRVQPSSTVKWNQWCLDKFSLAVIKVLAFAARARLQRNLGARCLLDLVDFFS